MKVNYLKIFAYWLMLMVSVCGVLLLTSCATPNPKKQKKHYDKFVYYGGKIDTVKQTVEKEVLVKGKDGKDSLIYVSVDVECPEPKIDYRDRWHIRRMDKAERDSMKSVERMLKIKVKSSEKLAEIERKRSDRMQKEMTKQAEAAAKQAKHENKSKLGAWIAIGIVVLLILVLLRLK